MAAWSALLAREWMHLIRRPARVVTTLVMPMLLWGVLGAGLGEEVVLRGVEAGAYLVPGMVLLMASFGTMFASISLIQDAETNLHSAMAVGRVPGAAVVGSKLVAAVGVLGLQAVVFVVGAKTLGTEMPWAGVVAAALGAAVAGLITTGIGLTIAARADSVASFHGVINLVLPAMWLTSGAVFPRESAAGWIRGVMLINPLAWAHDAMAGVMFGEGIVVWAWCASVGAGLVCAGAAMGSFRGGRVHSRAHAHARMEKTR